MTENRCISYGEIIPEGMIVCPNCLDGNKTMRQRNDTMANENTNPCAYCKIGKCHMMFCMKWFISRWEDLRKCKIKKD